MTPLTSIPLPVQGGFIPPGGGFGASRAKQSGNATSVHSGLDIAVAISTIVSAPLDGVVFILEATARAGTQMRLKHANGYTTGYAHLSKILVLDGITVTAGTAIALTGDTGDAAGHPHLHFTLRVNGVAVDP
ncbi:MAG TPA: M23 family metallopeptidase, partial [Bacteroidia bacterium]|nr:M23 family metallopeptidase [Bacteroidia bacterium]